MLPTGISAPTVTHYEKETEGIRVRVQPTFSPSDSDPFDGHYVFSYHVAMENEGSAPARLLFRHWRIHDPGGDDAEVDGEGVVGEQPSLKPGESHAYSSYCVLRSPTGYMEGHYTFVRPDGERFEVEVPRFHFTAPFMAPPLVPPPLDPEDPGEMN
jgi:ApaG protein